MDQTLKIAIQKSGRLLDSSLSILKECGIRIDKGNGQLKASASNYPVEVLYLRNSDIPQYVSDGVADLAILGQNTVYEKDNMIREVLPLGFSKCRVSLAIPKNENYQDSSYFEGKRIATSYRRTLQNFLDNNGLQAEIHKISGSVEIAPNIGLADGICDIVSTGSTLFTNGLREVEVIYESEAALFAAPQLSAEKEKALERLVFRLKAVLAARNNKYVMLNAPDKNLDQIAALLPGMRSPTITPLRDKGWSSVQSVIRESDFWQIIDQLQELGAEGILITPIEKMIL